MENNKLDKSAWVRYGDLLFNDKVVGNFDLTHLKNIHAYIFQDSPFIRPGEVRSDSLGDYVKNRNLEQKGISYPVFYATHDLEKKLDTVLKNSGGVSEFKNLNDDEFSKKMAKLYGDLDHIHPFLEGNSRTIRFFTSQLARACDKELNWKLTNDTKSNREDLYLARDFEVAKRQFPGLTGEKAFSSNSSSNELDIYRYFLGQVKNDLPLEKIINNCLKQNELKNQNTNQLSVSIQDRPKATLNINQAQQKLKIK